MAARFLLVSVVSLAVGPALLGAEPAKDDKVSYYREIRPIIQVNCQGCHQPAKAQGGYVMTSHAGVLKKGDSDKDAIVPGKPDASYLVEQITPHDGKRPSMPKDKTPLLDSEVALLKKWITQGAVDDTPASAREVVDLRHPPTYTLPPVLTALAYSPDGTLLAVSGYHEILLHKAAPPKGGEDGIVARLVGLSERIQALAFSPDGSMLAAAGGSPGRFGEIQVWNVAKKKLQLSLLMTFDTLYGVSWSHDNTRLAFGCGDNTLRAIEVATGKQILYQGAHSDWVLDTVFSTDSSHLVSVSRDMSLKLTEVATQRFVDNITSITPGALKGGLMTVDRHPLRDEVVIGGSDGVPKIYRLYRQKGQERKIGDDFNKIREFAGLPGRIFAARYNGDGSRIIVGSSKDGRGEVRIFQSADGKQVSKLEGQQGAVYAVAFRPEGKEAAQHWQGQVGSLVASSRLGPFHAVPFLHFPAAAEREVASAGFDGLIRIHDPQTGKLLREFVAVPLKAGEK